MSRGAEAHGRKRASGARIDACHRAVALIEGPDRAIAGGQEARIRPRLRRAEDLSGAGIDVGDLRCIRAGHPERAIAEARIVGAWRKADRLPDRSALRIDSGEGALCLGDQPHAPSPGRDTGFSRRRTNREDRRDPVGAQTHARQAMRAQRHPQAPRSRCEPRAGLTRDRDGGDEPVCVRVDAMYRIRTRASDPHGLRHDQYPIGRLAEFQGRDRDELCNGASRHLAVRLRRAWMCERCEHGGESQTSRRGQLLHRGLP